MNRKLLLLLALLLFSYGLSSCSSDDNSPSEGEQTETPELFTKRYNPDQSFYSKILGQEIKYSVLLPQEYLSESTVTELPVLIVKQQRKARISKASSLAQ